MAKINIVFNDKNYSIEEASFSAAADALKQHLSTAMNGSGATINLGGVSYGIDSAKLATATSEFISHLGKIAGNGRKVVVGGVEYGIDSGKVSGAVAEIEAVLGGAISGDGGNELVKSEHGFYYNVPYMYTWEYDAIEAFVFHEDGDMILYISGNTESDILRKEDLIYSDCLPYEIFVNWNEQNGNTISVSEDGMNFIMTQNRDGNTTQYVYTIDTGLTEHGIYYEHIYKDAEGNTFLFYLGNDGELTTSTGSKYVCTIGNDIEAFNATKMHAWSVGDYQLNASIDGKVLFLNVYGDTYRLELGEKVDAPYLPK
jgi:hypothetical protein